MTVYAGMTGLPANDNFERVFKSQDGGDTWTDISQGLPAFPVNDIACQPGSGGIIYAATDVGVFVYDPALGNWQCFNEELPICIVTGLSVNACEGKLYASTFGRSAWRTELYHPERSGDMVIGTDTPFNTDMAVTSDIRVTNGAVLTITSTVEMGPHRGIIVEPGAKLVVDGGTLTSRCFGFWRGIEVHGNSLEHQYPYTQPEHQGMVEVKGGAVIEHAREGVRLWDPGNYGSMGGVLIAEDATFLNCRRAVEGMKYEGFSPHDPNIPWKNRTRFNRVRFAVDENYRGGSDFDTHLSLWGMEGIDFVQCTWENLQPNMVESADLGHGITSGESSFRIRAGCSTIVGLGEPCPQAYVEESVFRNLDHGIHAENGNALSFSVDQARFENNVCGVYTNMVNWFSVTRSEFTMAERIIPLSGNEDQEFFSRHRGIYSYESHGFILEDNNLLPDDNPIQGLETEGIVVGYNRDFNDAIRANTASGLTFGFVGEGICSDVDNGGLGFIGLQHLCNTNNENAFNLMDRKVTTAGANEQLKHTMRLEQGDHNVAAKNQFDQQDQPMDESDFKRTSTNGVLTYYYGGLGNVEPADYTPVWVEPVFATHLPMVCEPRDYHTGRLTGVQKALLEDALEDGKTAYGNLRYAYNALLDGGNTDAVVEEIMNTWPSGAWELRAYLLGLSPFLTVGALQALFQEDVLPQAMALEICLANPDATQQKDFTDWVLSEAPYPLPQYMVEQIRASWGEEATLRHYMESEMAGHHRAMCVAAMELIADLRNDTVLVQLDSILMHIQQLPTWSARFDEATLRMERGEFDAARAVLDSLENHFDMRAAATAERGRMYDLLDILDAVRDDERTDAELDSAEIDALTSLAADHYDRAAHWAQNILCFHYGLCRPPLTGGGEFLASIPFQEPHTVATPVDVFVMPVPNPARNFVIFHYQLPPDAQGAMIIVRDVHGRQHYRQQVNGAQGQSVWDTRSVPAGAYTVELMSSTQRLAYERLIVQP
ncbi:MAG: hypothetical protein IPG10_06180 [Flavobacteriales bacterium]|nr:hypothetical protein [Flavobacteriales bacterium]